MALDDLLSKLAAEPEDRGLRLRVADLQIEAERFGDAEATLREGLAQAPRHEPFQLAMGHVFLCTDRLSEGLVIAENLTSRPSPEPAALLLLSRLAYESGDSPRAQNVYRRLLEIDPQQLDQKFAVLIGLPRNSVRLPGDEDDDEDVTAEMERHYREMRELHGGFDDFDEDDIPFGNDEEDGAPRRANFLEPDRPADKLAGLVGRTGVKAELAMRLLRPRRHPALFAAYGRERPGGVLLYGPDAAEREALARAVAGELEAALLHIDAGEMLDAAFSGAGTSLSKIIRSVAQHDPCVLYIEQLDQFMGETKTLHGTSGRDLIRRFFAWYEDLRGDEQRAGKLVLLAGSAAPWSLTRMVSRPGRFDRWVHVPAPDREAAAGVLRALLQGVPARAVDVAAVAQRCRGFTTDDLRAVVERAVDAKLPAAIRAGEALPLRTDDLVRAAKQVRASGTAWLIDARRRVAEAGHNRPLLHALEPHPRRGR